MRSADVMLLGGPRSYGDFVGYWPQQLDSDDADLRTIARRCAEVAKIVVSDRLREDPDGTWAATTTFVRRADAPDHLAKLKQESGGDLVLFGGRTLANDLFAHDLVDELHVMIGPVVNPRGVRAFDEAAIPPMRLVDVRRHEGSDNALLTYERAPAR
jgi:dihydrofolate reductase